LEIADKIGVQIAKSTFLNRIGFDYSKIQKEARSDSFLGCGSDIAALH